MDLIKGGMVGEVGWIVNKENDKKVDKCGWKRKFFELWRESIFCKIRLGIKK